MVKLSEEEEWQFSENTPTVADSFKFTCLENQEPQSGLDYHTGSSPVLFSGGRIRSPSGQRLVRIYWSATLRGGRIFFFILLDRLVLIHKDTENGL